MRVPAQHVVVVRSPSISIDDVPSLTSDGTLASARILRGGSKLLPPSLERVKSRAVCEAPAPQAT